MLAETCRLAGCRHGSTMGVPMAESLPGVLAACEHCGWRGRRPRVFTGTNSTVSFEDVPTPCPRCGQDAKVLDGTWGIDEAGDFMLRSGPPTTIQRLVEILTDERWDVERLRMLERALKSDAHGGAPDHKLDQVERIDPELGGQLRQWLASPGLGNATAVLSLLVAVIAVLLGQASASDGATPEQIREIFQQVAEHQQSQPPADTGPGAVGTR